ncbi:MAG: aminoglycoside phosphotransferase family protein [Rhodobiaceae bacterium]|nr:aminoglycoside phosphotransferase family protein [Rhodobiaceae bacterium]
MTTTGPATPAAEVHIDEALVQRLVKSQHPDLGHLAVTPLEFGWDNALYHLGDTYTVRLPRRAIAVPLLANEQAWLPKLAPCLPLPIPAPVRTGVAGSGYPWPWSILPWFEGRTVESTPLDPSEAKTLAEFLKALHQPAPKDAPTSDMRGCALKDRKPIDDERMARVRNATNAITPEIDETWAAALAAPQDTAPTWLHGDLHARNVLAHEGRITAIIDWGDITSGDRATDLASIWMLLGDSAARGTATRLYGDDDPALWARAKGWAVALALALLDTGLIDHPRHARMGRDALNRVAQDFSRP